MEDDKISLKKVLVIVFDRTADSGFLPFGRSGQVNREGFEITVARTFTRRSWTFRVAWLASSAPSARSHGPSYRFSETPDRITPPAHYLRAAALIIAARLVQLCGQAKIKVCSLLGRGTFQRSTDIDFFNF